MNMGKMTSRERVVLSLNHKEPDRVPFDCNFSYGAYLKLKEYLGLELSREIKPSNSYLSISNPPELIKELNIDLIYVGLGAPKDQPIFEYGMDTYTDEWGVTYRKIENDTGVHYEFANRILGEADASDIHTFPWPNPYNPFLTADLEDRCRSLYEATDLALVGKFSNSIFEQAFYMRGYEQLLMDLLLRPDFVTALMSKLVDIALLRIEAGLKAAGKYIQVLRLAGDDLGQQTGLIISPKTFRKVLKPHFSRLYQTTKSLIKTYNPEIKVMTHTDGDVYPIIPDLIEMGLDVLNPVQPYVKEMDHFVLKHEYGHALSFHGGIDIQHVMPFGTTEEVKAEAIKTMRALGPQGGYILAPTHYIQPDVPPENIIALRDTVLEFGRYPFPEAA
jgi:uroporphyrinogen decarboxylase